MLILLGLLALTFLWMMSIINAFTLIRFESTNKNYRESQSRISVLIPARNETKNLERLLPALLRCQPAPHEILILDDDSEDGTASVARRILERGNIPFRILAGRPWSASLGLTGKNHACAQLAEAAKGNVFLFCDADVVPSSRAIARTAEILDRYRCAGLSALPRQFFLGECERLTYPWVLQLPLLTLLPLAVGWKTRFASLQMANGQWLAVRRDRYQEIGGHAALGQEIVEDLALARRLANPERGGLIPVLASGDLTVRMYEDWDQFVEGFAKNLVQIYGGHSALFLSGVFLWTAIFCFPLWAAFFQPAAALLGGLLIVSIRTLSANLFRAPKRDLFRHFQSLYLLVYLACRVAWLQSRKQILWKGRRAAV